MLRIGIIGELTRFEELKQTLPESAEIFYDEKILPGEWNEYNIVFDLNYDERFSLFDILRPEEGTIFLLSASMIQLKATEGLDPLSDNILGMNCLPTFINRDVKEISYHSESQLELIRKTEALLNWKIIPVKDRVGMVSLRILLMIINEAYFTLQEGTAGKTEIDLAMKLGTNYPFGPFEWCERIGIKTVVTQLKALYLDTGDERYKICPLLKTESFNQ